MPHRRRYAKTRVVCDSRPSLAAFPVPYSAHGQTARLEESQGSGAPDARQGGARAARADRAALEKLLNPGIAKGTAGVGSQTGLNNADKPARRANEPLPGGEG